MKFHFLFYTIFIAGYLSGYSQTAVSPAQSEYLSSLLENSILFDTARLNDENKPLIVLDPEGAWRNWQTVENFTYGKDRGILPMIADLNSLHPYFRDKIVELIHICRKQGIELAVVESFRTHAKQAEYFGMGRKYTRSKGGTSKHQYGLAVDVVPIVKADAMWDNISLWRKIGQAGEKLGLRWGGRWRAPYDPAHFEWTGGISTYHLANGHQPAIPKSKAPFYPCMEENIKLLQKGWDAWEVEQAVSARVATSKSVPTASSQKP
jgi:peptidoglycan L-alanyl-D-glutamate endopeptidase CwlK